MACNITQNYNTPSYSEYEMDKYSEYIEYVDEVVNNSNIPDFVKKEMIEKRNLHKRKNNTSWFLEELGYELNFQPFRQWLLQEERNKKIEQILNGY